MTLPADGLAPCGWMRADGTGGQGGRAGWLLEGGGQDWLANYYHCCSPIGQDVQASGKAKTEAEKAKKSEDAGV